MAMFGAMAYAQVSPDICYQLDANRFFKEPGVVGFTDFTATPTPDPADLFQNVRLEISYTGVAPVQSLSGPMCITWNSADTTGVTVDLVGAPDPIKGPNGDELYL